jgi:O-antigen ligase
MFGLACGAALLADQPEPRQRLLEAISAAAAVVSAIGIWQHLELTSLAIPVISAPGATFGNRNLAAEAVAMSLPLTVGAAAGAPGPGTRTALIAALALELVYLAATRTRGAWLGGAAGLLTVLALARPRWSRRAVAVALIAVALAASAALIPGPANPRYIGDQKRLASGIDVAQASFDPQSIALRTRLGLWRRTLEMVRDHPIWGVGPGNWPIVFPRYAEPSASREGVLSAAMAPRQAHDDVLERIAETGVVGFAAFAWLVLSVVLAVQHRLRAADESARASTAAAAGALVALAGAGCTGFPLEMPATIALGGLALGLVAPGAEPVSIAGNTASWTLSPRAARIRPWLGRAAVGLAVSFVLWAGVRAERELRASYWLGRAERTLRSERSLPAATRALYALDRARAANPDEFRVHLRTSQMMLRLHRASDAAQAARRALALEPVSPNAWATLAAAQLAKGDARGARASTSRALDLLHDYPFALFVDGEAARLTGDSAGAASDWAHLHALAAQNTIDQATAEAARELISPQTH